MTFPVTGALEESAPSLAGAEGAMLAALPLFEVFGGRLAWRGQQVGLGVIGCGRLRDGFRFQHEPGLGVVGLQDHIELFGLVFHGREISMVLRTEAKRVNRTGTPAAAQ